jgi:hypothetical protein
METLGYRKKSMGEAIAKMNREYVKGSLAAIHMYDLQTS